MNAITTPAVHQADGSASTTAVGAVNTAPAIPGHQTPSAHAPQQHDAATSPAAETPARGTPAIYTPSGAIAAPLPATNTFGSA